MSQGVDSFRIVCLGSTRGSSARLGVIVDQALVMHFYFGHNGPHAARICRRSSSTFKSLGKKVIISLKDIEKLMASWSRKAVNV